MSAPGDSAVSLAEKSAGGLFSSLFTLPPSFAAEATAPRQSDFSRAASGSQGQKVAAKARVCVFVPRGQSREAQKSGTVPLPKPFPRGCFFKSALNPRAEKVQKARKDACWQTAMNGIMRRASND
ncbi:MAG: hypothetical protein CRN43_22460 [Candidatus Nephrothrix sp. EaCA]|nr:MAG: hypothetical protein CRN43_22460 [Candidatus Nephrothrix sp. EaCA]